MAARKRRGRANRFVPAVLWAALVPVWLSGEAEICFPITEACREVACGLVVDPSALPAVVAGMCDAIEAEANPVLRRMMTSRLWACRERPPVGSSARVDALLEDTVPVLSEAGSTVNPPGLLAVPRRHFSEEPALTPAGISGTRVEVRVGDVAWGDSSSVALGLTTVFATATRVADAAERWAGRPVDWGHDGRLTCIPYWRRTEALPAYYDQEERAVYLAVLEESCIDVARVPDATAHETGHAVVGALKPGWRSGVSIVLHEGIADMIAVLIALENPWVLERVLRETGGGLRNGNEATRLCELLGDLPAGCGKGALRSIGAGPTMGECGLDVGDEDMPAVLPVAGPEADPHRAAQIVSGLLYDVFCRAYEHYRSGGTGAERAVVEAQSLVGRLMLRSLDYCGEHRVSLEDYASALVQANRNHLDGALGGVLEHVLAERGLISPGDEGLAGDPQSVRARLDPALRAPAEILGWAEDLEEDLLSQARAAEATCGRFIRHHTRFPFTEEVGPGEMRVWGDTTSTDGYRVVRLRYGVPASRGLCASGAGGVASEIYPDESLLPAIEVFVGMVFDPSGALLLMHTDRPWED